MMTMRARNEINKSARKVNVELARMGRTFYDHLPIVAVSNLVEEHGFTADALEGIYCGHEGRVHQPIGHGKYIQINWCRIGDNNRFELNCYVS